MVFLAWLRQVLLNENDALANFRPRIALPVSAAGMLLVAPFGVVHLVQGRSTLGVAILGVVVLLGFNVVALRRGREPPVHYGLLLLPILAAIVASMSRQGVYGALWAYTLLLVCYFVLSRAQAFIASLVVLAVSTAGTAIWVDAGLAVRVFATQSLTIAFVNVILNVLGELQEALVRQAVTDPLTGAFNRRHMAQSLDLLVEQGSRRAPDSVMLMIDIDHFKQINDRHGHPTGDAVLCRLVQLLTQRKRKGDLLFRVGGEEFVLVLTAANPECAARVAEDLRRLVEASPLLDGQRVTVSIGVAAQRAGESASDWLKSADDALYRAKSGGRNRIELAGSAA